MPEATLYIISKKTATVYTFFLVANMLLDDDLRYYFLCHRERSGRLQKGCFKAKTSKVTFNFVFNTHTLIKFKNFIGVENIHNSVL